MPAFHLLIAKAVDLECVDVVSFLINAFCVESCLSPLVNVGWHIGDACCGGIW